MRADVKWGWGFLALCGVWSVGSVQQASIAAEGTTGGHSEASTGATHGAKPAKSPPAAGRKTKAAPATPAATPPPAPPAEPPAPPTRADDVLEISLLDLPASPIPQGSIVTLKFLVKNPTDDVIVLREVWTDNRDEDPSIQFVMSGYGTVSYESGRDAYVHDALVQQATPRVFNHGVLLPGESRKIEVSVRALQLNQTLNASFFRLPLEDFRRVAFVPIEGGSGHKVTYAHLQTLPVDHLKPRQTPDGTIMEKPFILWEDLLSYKLQRFEQQYGRAIPLKALPMTESQARQSAGFEGQTTYWSWGGGWVVMGEQQGVLVTAEGKRSLPRTDLRLFRDIDSGRTRLRVKLNASVDVFKSRFVSREGDGMYTSGEFIEVPRERLWELFDMARGENARLTRETYLFDAYYYVLEPMP